MSFRDSATLIGLGAAALAAIDLALAAWFLVWMRRVRRAQRALLAGENVDLVEFAVGMQARQEQVERAAADVQTALAAAKVRIDACLQHRAIVRYDAYVDAGGRQSTSIALLDERGSGVVVSAIQDRSYARIYVKDVSLGSSGDVALSPEEQQAVDAARAAPAT
jgi:Tfp pilus assembly protein PilN